MKTAMAPNKFDEPVTDEGLRQAIERGQQRSGRGLHAVTVKYLQVLKSKLLLISFADETAVALPIDRYPEFAKLTKAELSEVVIGFGGNALCLESRDLHVSIAGLVSASEPLMEMAATVIASRNGSKSSEVKAAAARENGQKGGRPRRMPLAAS